MACSTQPPEPDVPPLRLMQQLEKRCGSIATMKESGERPRRADRRAQARQFSHKFIKDRGEAHAGLAIGLHDFCFVTLCQGNDIDGTVIEMQPPAIGQQRNLRAAGHSPVPTGQGLSSFQASTRMLLPCPGNLSSPTMALTWPPSAA